MKILIAEAKTMERCTAKVSAEVLRLHKPCFDAEATELMNSWSECDSGEIASALKVSSTLASVFRKMAFEFPNKHTGCCALAAFTGVVFKAFDYASLNATEKQRATERVAIISSLYGWLRGDDIVKPYRLDYSARMAPDGESMAAFWREKVTKELAETLRSSDTDEVLDLLPADAAKCVDWKLIRGMARVVKVDFRSVADGGRLTTPHATLLKKLRGKLLREIVKKDISSVAQLMDLESDTMWIDRDSRPDSGTITVLVG